MAVSSLWQQLLTPANLYAAKEWLVAQVKHQDKSDVWGYLHHWDTHRTALIHQLKNHSFRFQTVSKREITDALGETSWREIRCAQGRC